MQFTVYIGSTLSAMPGPVTSQSDQLAHFLAVAIEIPPLTAVCSLATQDYDRQTLQQSGQTFKHQYQTKVAHLFSRITPR